MAGKKGMKSGKIKNMTNQRFGKLLVVSFSHTESARAFWNCVCDCGKECVKCGFILRQKKANSCGCLYSERQLGEKNNNWMGGITDRKYPLDFYRVRNEVRDKYNHTCQECGVIESRKKFSCHHIDYDKANNDISNLILLCQSCHVKTNRNRDMWKIKYMESSNVSI
jgi:5-methylcytosine-specific restriction endonuclease McrA